MIGKSALILAIVVMVFPTVNSSLPRPETKTSDPIWFVHITDLHISKFGAARRSEDLRLFCNFMVRNIKPTVVIISGDLTDAKHANMYGSQQFKEEWSTYSDILNGCGIQSVAKVLDIRGNHDTFNVLGDHSSENYFHTFGAQGRYHPRSYEESIVRGDDDVSIRFVAIDFTRKPGLRRPFNFFGTLAEEEITHVKGLLAPRKEFKHQVLFGHYPTSSIYLPGHKARELLGHQVYLCGHYHVPSTYLRHKASGLLELELSDWKDRRSYRIAAFDNGQFAFADKTYHALNPNVAVIVTNPKNPMFKLAGENATVEATLDIRALIFSDTNIYKVEVKIDNEKPLPMYLADPNSEAPVYTVPWNPWKYKTGLHKINVLVTLPNGDVKGHKDVFSFDGTKPTKLRYDNIKSIILLAPDWQPSSSFVFFVLTCSIILPITGFRLYFLNSVRLYGNDFVQEPSCMRKVWILMSMPQYYRPLILFALYGSYGPLMIAPVVENKRAVVFANGLYMIPKMNYVPPDLIYPYAIGYSLLHVFFIYTLACTLEKQRFPQLMPDILIGQNAWYWELVAGLRLNLVWEHLGVFCVLLIQLHNIWALYNSYGLGSIISPVGIGRPLFCTWLYLSAFGPIEQ